MNYKNLAENLIITIVVGLLCAFIGFTAARKANQETIELLTPTITEAIKKNTTAIENTFKTEIRKVKNKNGTVELDIDPVLESQIKQTLDTTKTQPEKPKRKKKFLGIF